MKDGIGAEFTRKDHAIVADQLLAAYAKFQEVTALSQVIGEDELSKSDQYFMMFGKLFETHFINQGDESRRLGDSLDLGWDLLSILPENALNRLSREQISNYINKEKAYARFGLNQDNNIEHMLERTKFYEPSNTNQR